ncbi:lanthionine synthetase C family protein [Chryseobacterium sp. ISL-6]|uniref:lanthionine synthetase C family protein n=1 Tax=Chryseobacterium sp. ISL-6 TaxID=2819143 RepID=UPI001BE7FCE2|nr:lanthionine synthetase C family protein [Chryseobacterium sp. ISL-6]MBT2620618.1 lanthionine synthetase C family protein [Chryseobacterium sp. ISL-6]
MSLIISNNKQKEIENLLSFIAEGIVSKNNNPNLGLLSGAMGETLFLYEYSQINIHYKKYVSKNIDYIFESIENGNVHHTYCNGLPGICLGIDYIESKRDKDYKNFDFVDDQIDEWLIEQFNVCIEDGNYDFLHGAIGIGIYFLQKFKKGDIKSKKILNILLKFLYDSAIKENGIIKWKNHNNIVNISLSHGMTSIVLFLLELSKLNIKFDYDIEQLVKGAISFILAQEIDLKTYNSFYPFTSIEQQKDKIHGSRLSWCYGDLGIAIMLRKSSEIFNQTAWEEKSREILEFSTTRKNSKETTIVDAGICHGSSGVALIFYNEYLKTNNEHYAKTAQFWLDRTLEYYKEDPEHFSKVCYDTITGNYMANPSILDGTSGVGLVLLSFITNQLDWSKFLTI